MRFAARQFVPGRRFFTGLAAAVGILLIVLFVFVRFFLDERLRNTMEHNANARLQGYNLRISKVRFHPIGFSIDLLDAYIVQDAYPDPPVAYIPLLHASVHWTALLHGRLVAEFYIDRPKLNINLKQVKKEIDDKVPISDRGWQDALQAIYPLKINLFTVNDAEVAYQDQGPFKPLHLTKVNLQAENIRNVRSRDRVYPSEVHLHAVVFDSGKLSLDGNADFLAKPHMGVQADLSLEQIALDYFKPITNRYNLNVRKGTLNANGQLEYARTRKTIDLEDITLQGVDADYVHKSQTAAAEEQTKQQIKEKTKAVANEPGILVHVDEIRVVQGRLAYVNQAAEPEYALYFTDTDLRVTNLTNHAEEEGASKAKLEGRFMGSGATLIDTTFWPRAKIPEFDLDGRIENTDLTALNGILRNYGFDVHAGEFSLYTQLSARGGKLKGYIKPIFRHVDILDSAKDADKPFGQRLKEGFIAAVAWIFSNKPKDQIATTIPIEGDLGNPQYGTWSAIGGILKNAFIQAIRPGLENRQTVQSAPDKETPGGAASQQRPPG